MIGTSGDGTMYGIGRHGTCAADLDSLQKHDILKPHTANIPIRPSSDIVCTHGERLLLLRSFR